MKLSSIKGPTKPSEACFTSGGGLDTIFRVTYYCIHEDLDTLRRFRDNCLPKDLVTLYYKTSPPIANFIKEKDWLRFLVRQPIRLIVKGLKLKDQTNQKITT